METVFRKVSVKGVEFDCTKVNQQSYVAVASITAALAISPNVIHNILGRVSPYMELVMDVEKRDAKNRLQTQKCIPLSLVSGLLEKVKSSKAVSGHPETKEKAEYLMTLFILLSEKVNAEHLEMSEDLIAIMQAQAAQEEVFNERAHLAHKMRESKKLIGSYFTKYQDKINGQLTLGE